MGRMITEQLTIVFNYETLDARVVLDAIRARLAELNIPVTGFELDEAPVDLVQARARLAGREDFDLTGHGFKFHLAVLGNRRLDFLEISAAGQSRLAWDEWIAPFIRNPNFVMAWLADEEYEYWQNAYDFLQYTSVGRAYDHLPKKSNGLPPPLEQQVIDTSRNPGRRLLKTGYNEVVGAVMWLGDPFWTLAEADIGEVEHASWLKVSRPQPAVVRLEVLERCFTTEEGIEGDLQRRLRSLLFPLSGRDK